MDTSREYYEEVPVIDHKSNSVIYIERSKARISELVKNMVKALPVKRYHKQVKYSTQENISATISTIEERNYIYEGFIWIQKTGVVKEKPYCVFFYGMPIAEDVVFKKKVKNIF